jgi:predicted metal-dependent peptidase
VIIQEKNQDLYNRRMTKAATALVIRHPFFGYLLFGSSVKVVARAIPTMATDGRSIYCGIDFVSKEPIEILEFGLLHELLHIYFNHHARRGSRDAKVWNIAVDIFTNEQCSLLLSHDNGNTRWPIPARFIQPAEWALGKSCEEIYDILMKAEQDEPDVLKKLQPAEDELGSGSDMIPMPEPLPRGVDPLDPQGSKDWQGSFQQDVASARAMADKTVVTKRLLTDAVRDRMAKILKSTLPWGSILRGDLSYDLGWDEATYCPPKTKYYPIILPQTRSTKERVLLLGIDISTSVTDDLIQIFISNVMSAAMKATKTVVVTFDQFQRDYYETTNPKTIFEHVKFKSGAHYKTSAMCVFEHADRLKPSAICLLTDGHIEVPETAYKNTTFVIPTGGAHLPWGRHIVMEYQW